MKDYVELLRALMKWEPHVHIFGGIAEDALLHGRLTRHHEDVDVLVHRDELPTRLAQARALGFDQFHLRMDSWPGTPLVIGAVEHGLNLEIVIFDREPDGRTRFDVPTPSGMKRVWLPDDALTREPTALEGVRVRTVSPLALYQIRAGVAETFGGFRPKDVPAQAALRARFFPDVPEARLVPRSEAVSAEAPTVRAVRAPERRRA